MIPRVARHVAPFVFSWSLASCGGAHETAPPTVTPPKVATPAIIELGVSSQIIIVGFATSIAATVKDAEGRVLTGNTVAWTSRDTSIAVVNAQGVVTGRRIGIVDVVASVGPLMSSPITLFVARGLPSKIDFQSAVPLSGIVGQDVANPPTVRVADAQGFPVPGILLMVKTAAGSGQVVVTLARTDTAGLVRVDKWTLGTKAGRQQLIATSDAIAAATASIDAIARPGAPASLRLTRGDNQEGSMGRPLADSLEAAVADQYQNAIAGVAVRFSAVGGSITPATVATDSSGRARASWTLASQIGMQSGEVLVDGLAAVGVRATAFGFRAKTVSTGAATTCATDLDDRAWCWGGATGGARPTLISPTLRFSTVKVGDAMCGLETGGAVYCWGDNRWGSLGDGTQVSRMTPQRVALDSVFVDLATAELTSCALTRSGAAFCWGAGWYGQLGYLSGIFVAVPTRVPTGPRWAQLRSTVGGFCALSTAFDVYCWGAHLATGALGLTYYAVTRPFLVSMPEQVTELRGWCGLTASQLGRCIGLAATATVEISTWNSQTQVQVAGPLSEVSADYDQGCAITTTSRLFCWGANRFGLLGTGDTLYRAQPVEIGATQFVARVVSQGRFQTCVIDTKRQVWCWGYNSHGAAGVSPPAMVLTPTLVVP